MENKDTTDAVKQDDKKTPDASKPKKKVDFDTFMKALVGAITIQGMICVVLTYILAFMGRDNIAEVLSQAIVSEILGTTLIYGITKTIENVSQYNTWFSDYIRGKYHTPTSHDKEGDMYG